MNQPHRPRRGQLHRLAARVVVCAVFGAPVAAQPAATPMTPSPPHEALSFFEGSWTIEERPAPQEFVEACAWLPAGRRHMVCRSTWLAASGAREGWSIFSYRAADSTYLYHGLRAGGAVEPMQGRQLPDGWEFLSEAGVGAERQRMRVVITQLAAQRFRLVASAATGDGPWEVVGTEHYVPAVPRP